MVAGFEAELAKLNADMAAGKPTITQYSRRGDLNFFLMKFEEAVADYEKMAQLPSFRSGLERLVAGAKHHRIAAICAEAEPLDCHRCLLVGRALAAKAWTSVTSSP